jgi:hypothetical protein
MLDLAEVLEFIDNGLDQRSLPQYGRNEIGSRHRPHVLTHLGDEVNTTGAEEFRQPFGELKALVPEYKPSAH